MVGMLDRGYGIWALIKKDEFSKLSKDKIIELFLYYRNMTIGEVFKAN